jgi:DNA binding domain, excisionase family
MTGVQNADQRPLNLAEAADFLRVSKPTMGKLIREGRIKAVKVGRDWRITKAALDSFLAGENAEEKP